MADCKTCIHSAFDPLWGEYKCKVRTVRIYDPDNQENCKEYEKQVKKKGS